jgi:hypothetical protein
LKQIERYSKYMQNSSDIDTIISIYNWECDIDEEERTKIINDLLWRKFIF